jgi:hypothetical protein
MMLVNSAWCKQLAERISGVSTDELWRLLERNGKRLDLNDDGIISSAEIDFAIEDSSLQGQDALLVGLLKIWLCRPNWFRILSTVDESSGEEAFPKKRTTLSSNFFFLRSILIAIGDSMQRAVDRDRVGTLGNILREASSTQSQRKAIQLLIDNFAQIDLDGSGSISKVELENYFDGGETSAAEGLIREYFVSAFNALIAKKKGLSRSEQAVSLEEFAGGLGSLKTSRKLALTKKIRDVLGYYRRRVNRADSNLYGEFQDPLQSISYLAIRQGIVGDCSFLASLAAIAAVSPRSIQDMLTDNGDGTYTVVFPCIAEEKIVVKKPTAQELMLYAGGSKYGIWPAVLEKACGLHCRESLSSDVGPLRNVFYSNIANENIQFNFYQGVLSRADDVLLLKEADLDKLHFKLASCFRKRIPITVGRFPFFVKRWKNGIVSRHAYALVEYNPATKKVGVYNPWGRNRPLNPSNLQEDARDNGLLEMGLSSFISKFDYLLISKALAPR